MHKLFLHYEVPFKDIYSDYLGIAVIYEQNSNN